MNRTDSELARDGRYDLRSRDFSLKLLNIVAASGDIAYFDHLVSRGADPRKSLALHSASKCEDSQQATAMINHLLDMHHMQIEANNEDLRDFFHAAGDSGTPLNSAVYHQNLPAVLTLLARGANPDKAVYQTIDYTLKDLLPALGPLLDAGADANKSFEHAVDRLNFEAAKISLEKGADPTRALRMQRAKAAKKATHSFDRDRDEEHGDGGDSTDDDEDLAAQRKKMRKLVSSANCNGGGMPLGLTRVQPRVD